MNPETPQNPRAELEARLTALLLGELPPDQAEAMREAIAQDPELAKLQDRLKPTLDLLRQTVAAPPMPADAPAAPLKLAEERRQKLLQHFKTVAPIEFSPTRNMKPHWAFPMSIAAVLVLSVGLALFWDNLNPKRPYDVTPLQFSASRTTDTLGRESLGEKPPSAVNEPNSLFSQLPTPAPGQRTAYEAGRAGQNVTLSSETPVARRSLSRSNPASDKKAGTAIVLPPASTEVADAGNLSLGKEPSFSADKRILDETTQARDNAVSLKRELAMAPEGNVGSKSGLATAQQRNDREMFMRRYGLTPTRPHDAENKPIPNTDNYDQLFTFNGVLTQDSGQPQLAGGFGGGGFFATNAPASGATLDLAYGVNASPSQLQASLPSANERLRQVAENRLAEAEPQLRAGVRYAVTTNQAESLPVLGDLPMPGTMFLAKSESAGDNDLSLALPIGGVAAAGRPVQLTRADPNAAVADVRGAQQIALQSGSIVLPSVQVDLSPPHEMPGKDSGGVAVKPPVTHAEESKTGLPKRYLEAKARLEQLEQANLILQMKIAAEGIDTSLPKAGVAIVDPAKPEEAKRLGVFERLKRVFGTDTERTTTIAVGRNQADIAGLQSQTAAAYDPYFLQTELEALKSDAVLGKAVHDLKLDTDANHPGLSDETRAKRAVQDLKQRLELQPVPRTNLVNITVKGDSPAESARLANSIAEAYSAYQAEQRQKLTQEATSTLNQRLQEQAKEVKQAQTEVDRLRGLEEKEDSEATGRKAAVPIPTAPPEVTTSDNPFSTFSLNVSDVSFKLAAASLEKGVMPDASTVRSEEFINAFDYRDPEAPVGVPVAFAWERARYPFAQNRDLLRFSLKTAAQGRQPGRPLNLVLLLDNSGSMERADRVSIIREALKVLAAELQPQDKFSIVTFARTARLFIDGVPGNQAGQAVEEVSKLTPQGGTNLEEAMNLAYETAKRHYLPEGVNRVVLLTDGAANLGEIEPESLKQKVESNRTQGIALDCFGIGWEGYNDDLLEVLSRNGDGRYGFINSPEAAASEFAGQLAGALHVAASDVKVQVEFNPARVPAYRQIGYARHQLTKEQFRDNTVDAAEIGAAESGNALYVAEINPSGSGPVATVRIRYKVPGTAEYREHEWVVPYTGNAIPLEQASPALRLAATASAFSEWLVSSPYAGEVTPDRLLGYLSGVPELFGADPRPKKLEWMLRQAKSITGR